LWSLPSGSCTLNDKSLPFLLTKKKKKKKKKERKKEKRKRKKKKIPQSHVVATYSN
jgi:hypothetical protein